MNDRERLNHAWESAVALLRLAGLLLEGYRLELRDATGAIVASFVNVKELPE